jgi:DNA polymerase-1
VEHVHSLALALYDTEVRGVRVDLDYLSRVGSDLQQRIDSGHVRMQAAAPEAIEAVENEAWLELIEKYKSPAKKASIQKPAFNWNSTTQLQKLIYGELGLPVVTKWDAKKKERRPTLDDGALEELAELHPLVAELRNHRGDVKVYGSFIQGTFERHVGGYIFPSFHVNGTVTGRISSSNPNLQQLPREGGVRGIYVPAPGARFISSDYGMLEVVVAAHYSQDPALLSIIHDGASKHDITAAALGIDRQTAKTLNFALGYGATEFKVKQILGCSLAEAKGSLNRYWEAYAGEKKIIDECKALVDEGKPIISLFGRRRHFPKTFATDKDRGRAYRQAYNSLIQGTGSDITHKAFYETARHMEARKLGRAVFEVHDEILIEAHTEQASEAREALKRIMLEAGSCLSVPLTVDVSEPMERWLS